MTTETKGLSHPMLIAAGIALILFCAVGIAAMMGWIPNSVGRNLDQAELAAAKQQAADKSIAAAEQARRAAQSAKTSAAPVLAASKIKASCASCGVIESVRAIETRGQGSGVGAVGGAVVGGLLGNQVGGGSGKDAMTVAGAIGGALAGNHIEKNVRSTTSYEVVVRMENGASQVIHAASQPSWRSGDQVKVIDGVIRAS